LPIIYLTKRTDGFVAGSFFTAGVGCGGMPYRLFSLFWDADTMAKGKKILTSGEVAEICNVAHRTVQKWFDNGLLAGYRLPGSGDRRIPVNNLISFMKANNLPIKESLLAKYAGDKGP